MFSGKLNWQKYFTFYLTTAAVIMALTACAQGFKSKIEDKTPVTGAGTANIAVPATNVTYNPLLELAMAQSPEVEAIAKDPQNQGKQILIDAKIGFAITQLDPNGTSSAHDSVLYLYITVQGLDGKSATALVTSNKAELALTSSSSSDVHIEGYWTVERKNQVYPYYIGLQSTAKVVGKDIHLQGTIIANLTGDAVQNLAQFDQSICELVVDPTPWIPKFFPQGTFGGCAAADSDKQSSEELYFDP